MFEPHNIRILLGWSVAPQVRRPRHLSSAGNPFFAKGRGFPSSQPVLECHWIVTRLALHPRDPLNLRATGRSRDGIMFLGDPWIRAAGQDFAYPLEPAEACGVS